MKLTTKLLIAAWLLFIGGLTYALLVPVDTASTWVLWLTALLGLPLIIHFVMTTSRDRARPGVITSHPAA